MHRFLSRLKRRDREGQGLVEYALILVLVAIVVIAILSLLAAIGQTYCTVIYNVDKSAAAKAKQCKKPLVTCSVISSNPFTVEAKVIDPDYPTTTPGDYDGENLEVQFYLNNQTQLRDGTNLIIESNFKYCFPAGNGTVASPCTGANIPSQARSGDTVKAIATDQDGNTGTCEVTVP